MLSLTIKKILCPTKLQAAKKIFGRKPLKVLDVGCGNHSYEIARHWLNIQEYVGLDREYWSGDKSGYEGIDRMIFTDLDNDQEITEAVNDYFDLVILNHVIEHLQNGEKVLATLFLKLRPGGMIYIETPDIKTLNFPSATGFLNFYDDDTHRRVYEVRALVAEMMRMGFVIHRFGMRRDWIRISLFTIPMVLYNLFYSLPFLRRLDARGLWDILGVASFVCASRPKK